MRVATGPGRVRDNLGTPDQCRLGRFGLLYNFDIDDATVKTEHMEWLEEVAVPVLKVCLQTEVFLNGTCSRSGSTAYNEGLSKKRVDSVKRFLEMRGVPTTRIRLNWVGELEAAAKGRVDGTESDEDRAVAVLVRKPRAPGPVKFERISSDLTEIGFDPKPKPAWLMVPALTGERTLRMLNGGGLRLQSSNPAILQFVDPLTNLSVPELIVSDDRTLISFRGGVPGEAKVFTDDLGHSITQLLQVSVLPAKTATVSFHFVEDTVKSGTNHQTTRSVGEEDAMLAEANRVFNRQANIFFTKKSAGALKVDKDLGDPVSYKTLGGSDLPFLRTIGDKDARIRVFYVWDYEPETKPGNDTDAEVDAIPGKVVVFEDDAGTDVGLSLAHEFGHCLGLAHRETSRELVMWPTTDERDGRLERDQVLRANQRV